MSYKNTLLFMYFTFNIKLLFSKLKNQNSKDVFLYFIFYI